MTEPTSNLEKALATERRNAREWEKRCKANRREADEYRGRAQRLEEDVKRYRKRIAHLEGQIAGRIAASARPDDRDERRDAILALAAMAGGDVTMERPGRFLEGPDGPVGMTANIADTGTIGGITITRAEARDHNIPADTPGIHIIDTEDTK